MGKFISYAERVKSKFYQLLRKKKIEQVMVSPLYGWCPKLFKRICTCGKVMTFSEKEHIKTLERKSVMDQAYMCELRFCPLCNFYRVQRITPQINRELKKLQTKGYEFIFMTFTVPNVLPSNLRSTIKEMNRSYRKMMKFKEFKQFHAWIRTLEITYNDNQEAHPHFHCIFVVHKDYFKRSNNLYINAKNGELSKLWTKAHKSEVPLICDMRKLKANGKGKNDLDSGIAELAKYVTKSADIEKLEKEWMPIIHDELKGLRFIATSQNIKLNEDEEIDEETLSDDEWRTIETVITQWCKNTNDWRYLKTNR